MQARLGLLYPLQLAEDNALRRDGSHTFSVRAKDSAGNVDPTPASRTFTVKTAAVSVSGSTLVVTAATGARDNLAITRPSASTLRVTDLAGGVYTGSGVHAGPGCARSGGSTANCDAAGITLAQGSSGDQPDKVVNSTTIRSSLNGGPAMTRSGRFRQRHAYRRNGNRLDEGDERNRSASGPRFGLRSDDQLRWRRPGTADNADLDLLPRDPNTASPTARPRRGTKLGFTPRATNVGWLGVPMNEPGNVTASTAQHIRQALWLERATLRNHPEGTSETEILDGYERRFRLGPVHPCPGLVAPKPSCLERRRPRSGGQAGYPSNRPIGHSPVGSSGRGRSRAMTPSVRLGPGSSSRRMNWLAPRASAVRVSSAPWTARTARSVSALLLALAQPSGFEGFLPGAFWAFSGGS